MSQSINFISPCNLLNKKMPNSILRPGLCNSAKILCGFFSLLHTVLIRAQSNLQAELDSVDITHTTTAIGLVDGSSILNIRNSHGLAFLRCDTNGAITWKHKYGNESWNSSMDTAIMDRSVFAKTLDTGFVIFQQQMYTESPIDWNSSIIRRTEHMRLARFDKAGNTVWQRALELNIPCVYDQFSPSPHLDTAGCVVDNTGSIFIYMVYSNMLPDWYNHRVVAVGKFSSLGELTWFKQIGTSITTLDNTLVCYWPYQQENTSVLMTPDDAGGCYLVPNASGSIVLGSQHIIKLGPDGSGSWVRIYSSPVQEIGSLYIDASTALVGVGRIYMNGDKCFLFRISSDGEPLSADIYTHDALPNSSAGFRAIVSGIDGRMLLKEGNTVIVLDQNRDVLGAFSWHPVMVNQNSYLFQMSTIWSVGNNAGLAGDFIRSNFGLPYHHVVWQIDPLGPVGCALDQMEVSRVPLPDTTLAVIDTLNWSSWDLGLDVADAVVGNTQMLFGNTSPVCDLLVPVKEQNAPRTSHVIGTCVPRGRDIEVRSNGEFFITLSSLGGETLNQYHATDNNHVTLIPSGDLAPGVYVIRMIAENMSSMITSRVIVF